MRPSMTPSKYKGTPATRADQFDLGSSDRDPSLARIGARLSQFYVNIPAEAIPERFLRLLEGLNASAPSAT